MIKKLVIVINGKGGVGKDTLCGFAGKAYKVRNVSAITPVKEIARIIGWDGEKDAKSRKMLADLKQLLIEYNDLPCQYLYEEYKEFLATNEQIMFVHIREAEEIEKFRRMVDIPCITLLITRKMIDNLSWGNESDDHVTDYNYDYRFKNDKSLESAEKDFVEYIDYIFNQAAKRAKSFDKRNFEDKLVKPFFESVYHRISNNKRKEHMVITSEFSHIK